MDHWTGTTAELSVQVTAMNQEVSISVSSEDEVHPSSF